MSDTAELINTDPEPVVADDPVPEYLRSWGLAGTPIDWAYVTYQPTINAIRLANRGFGTLDAVQAQLDAAWPDAGYQALDVALARPPVGLMSLTEGDDLAIRVDLGAADQSLGLPDENVTWYFGDGSIVHDAGGADHTYSAPGSYRVIMQVAVAGVSYQDDIVVTVGEVAAVVSFLEPAEVVCGGPDIVMRVHGSGFTEASVIVFNGGDEPTTFVSDTIVETGVKPSLATIAITVPIAVRTDSALSNSVGFSFLGGTAETVAQPEPAPAADTPVEPEPATEPAPAEPEPATEPAPAEPESAPEAYDPGAHTVDEVLAYAADHPDEVAAIITAEENGRNRVGILDKI